MRLILASLIAGATLVATSEAQSLPRYYPWCAIYSDRGGTRSCSFTSFEQCLQNIRGMGGFCVVNSYQPIPGYDIPAYPVKKPKRGR